MAMLRVSSYRKLFEEESWSRNGSLGMGMPQCADRSRGKVRGAAVDDCDCDKLDFVAAKSLNKEGLIRFVQDRTIISALNDRLIRLIELARCFERENESLECQIVELEEQLNGQPASSSISSTVAPRGCSLDAVVERLRKERDEILCDTEKLQKELESLKESYEAAAQQRVFLQQERQDVAEEVDAVTAECLALREQVSIYEEQLADMEAQHQTEVEDLLDPAEATAGAMAALRFNSPDMSPALDLKEFYVQLAESLQYEAGAAPSALLLAAADGKPVEAGEAAGPEGKEFPKDSSEMKVQISELQKELTELEKCNEELEDEVEMKTAAHVEQIAELECTIDEMRHQEAELEAQMKEQCEDYKELLREKMSRDMEIVAYRSLVEEEEERLCNL